MIYLFNLTSILIIGLFIYFIYKRQQSLLDLGIMFSVFLLIEYPFRILILYIFPKYAIPSYPDILIPGNMYITSIYQLLGIMGFCAGYLLITYNDKKVVFLKAKLVNSDRKDIQILFVVYIFSLLAKLYKIYTGNYMSFLIGQNLDMRWTNLIENIHMMGWICFAGVWGLLLQHRLKSTLHYIFFGMVNISELSYQIIQGSKTFLLLPLFILIVVYYYYRKKIPYIILIVATFFSLLFVFPFVHNFRQYVLFNYGVIPSFNQFDAMNTINETMHYTKIANEPLYMKFFTSFSRIAGSDELYNIIKLVPSTIPYKYGRDFISIIYGFIPRALWITKPSYSLGGEYGLALGSRAAITPYPIGQMYWDFGVFGIFFGMGIWSVVIFLNMKLFNKLFQNNKIRFYVISIFIAECYWLTTGESMFYMLIQSIIKKMVIYFVVFQIAKLLINRNNAFSVSPFFNAKYNNINYKKYT